MKNPGLTQLLVFLVTFAILTSCGGGSGGGSVAGIGGTGFTTGTVTGFGSVFVNGIEFETTDATNIEEDELQSTESGLSVGMVVTVTETIADDGTATTDSIVYDSDLEGPISDVPVEDPDGVTRTFTVLGTNIIVDKTSTVFDNEEVASFEFSTIAQNDVVEVSGFFDENGSLRATYIKKEGTFALGDEVDVDIEGEVTAVAGTNEFTLNGDLTVTFNSLTELSSDLPDDLNAWVGLIVEVEGTLTSQTDIAATEIEIEDSPFGDDADDVDIEGIISSFNADQVSFEINGQPVDASNAILDPEGLVLADGLRVEVEGPVSNGVLLAEKVEGRGGDIEIEATISALPSADTITLSMAPGQTLDVTFDSETRLDEEITTDVPLAVGDSVEIKARTDGEQVIATEIERVDELNEVILQGPVQTTDGSSTVTILGITYIGLDSTTDFERDDIDFASAAEFFEALQESAIVKVKDEIVVSTTTGDGTAEEMEIED